MSTLQKLCVLFLASISCAESFTSRPSRTVDATALAAANEPSQIVDNARRNAFKEAGALAAAIAFGPAVTVNALDMDAFANAQVRRSMMN